MSDFQIAGTEIPEPKPFEISEFDIKQEQRLASGKMIIKVVAVKKRFSCTWSALEKSDLATLLAAFRASDKFFTFTYADEGATQTATVRIEDVNRSLDLIRTDRDKDLYRGVTVVLEEQ